VGARHSHEVVVERFAREAPGSASAAPALRHGLLGDAADRLVFCVVKNGTLMKREGKTEASPDSRTATKPDRG